jgi:hypothetical protein
MAQRKPEDQTTIDQVLKLVKNLTPEAQEQLVEDMKLQWLRKAMDEAEDQSSSMARFPPKRSLLGWKNGTSVEGPNRSDTAHILARCHMETTAAFVKSPSASPLSCPICWRQFLEFRVVQIDEFNGRFDLPKERLLIGFAQAKDFSPIGE